MVLVLPVQRLCSYLKSDMNMIHECRFKFLT